MPNISEALSAYQEYAQASASRFTEPVQYVPKPASKASVGLDLFSLPEGYYAVPNGDTRLKVRIQKPAAPSKYAGWTFVTDGAVYGSARRYGRQAPGKTYTGEIVQQLTAILANPMAACAAYGHLTSRCGICNRVLEDAESVARGIGPICFGKFA